MRNDGIIALANAARERNAEYIRSVANGMVGGAGLLDELKAENAALKADNAALKAENAELSTENAALKAENAELSTENAALKAENAEISTENTRLKEKISELNARRKARAAK